MRRFTLVGAALIGAIPAMMAETICSPDSRLCVDVDIVNGQPAYGVTLNGKTILEPSPLGFVANIGDFTKANSVTFSTVKNVTESYSLDRIKASQISVNANEVTATFTTPDGKKFDVEFHVANNDVAFRYAIPKQGETGSIYIEREATSFDFPDGTTTFMCPQSKPMIGWKRTKPSYEEEYTVDAPMNVVSQYGEGYTFPCLFKVGDDGWVLLSETGVDSHYCGSHLSDYKDGRYTIAFPMPGENNGNGLVGAALALPGKTPWRTLAIGSDLAPVVESTVTWDLVKPLYESANKYKYGKGTWSWILWQDNSINIPDLKQFVDLAKAMKFDYILVDNWWDTNIGRDKLPELINYAHSQGIDVFMWYSSSGYWNDIVQGPVNCMDNSIVRKREMKWLHSLGVKGIKVDFFGGDKQETMRLYEEILSDADDNGLMVIFHGCTLPRGWERMYPNYVGSEAVLASENLIFGQHACDMEAFNAALHPFIRNSVGCMEFGGSFLNKRMHRSNNSGNTRRTTDAFELATAVLFQNPIQNFALAPNNLTDAPQTALDFLSEVPTTWDETRYIDGYPGRYAVIARRHADTWYIAGINAESQPVTLELTMPMLKKGESYSIICDDKTQAPVKETRKMKSDKLKITIASNSGFVIEK